MLTLIIRLVVRADDEQDIAMIAAELKQRIESFPALQQHRVKTIAVTAVEKVEG